MRAAGDRKIIFGFFFKPACYAKVAAYNTHPSPRGTQFPGRSLTTKILKTSHSCGCL